MKIGHFLNINLQSVIPVVTGMDARSRTTRITGIAPIAIALIQLPTKGTMGFRMENGGSVVTQPQPRLPDEDVFKLLVRNACFAADRVVIEMASMATGAQKVERTIEEALKCLFANGLIQAVPVEEWPQYVSLDPPYVLPKGWGG